MDQKKGFVYAALAFFIWGVYPLYWNLLSHLDATFILVNRMVWAFILLGIFIVFSKKGKSFMETLRQLTWKKGLLILCATALISTNWLVYMWAVNSGQILYASLGYYINPMVSILMGVLILKEKLTRPQLVTTLISGIGVLFLAINLGTLPWISLVLAFSFATYGLIKKLLKIDSIFSLFLETAFMFPLATWYLAGHASLNPSNILEMVLLVGGGFITIVPLFFFSKATQLIPLKYIGFIQYIGPTMGFLIGVFVFQENFTTAHLIAFACIWTACIIFAASQLKWPKLRLGRN